MTGADASDARGVLISELPPLPYPGLRPFKESEWPIFFGRERTTEDVITNLLQSSVVCVHGTSGCGKSSLVRAGVNATLQQEHVRQSVPWQTCSMRPGDAPLDNLATALAGLEGVTGGAAKIEVRRRLNRGRNAAAALQPLLGHGRSRRICVVIDQFEELFRFARHVDRSEATLLIDALIGIVQDRPDGLYALVTMRSEFLGECARFEGLAEVFNATQFLLPRMTKLDLIRAIQEPARLYGGDVEHELAAQMVEDVGGSQDELPLIQHGLMLLWKAAQRESPAGRITLTRAAYEQRGSLSQLLSDHADEVSASLGAGTASEDRTVETVLRALTDINAEGTATRLPQAFGDLVAICGVPEEGVRAVVDAFRADGVSFLTPYAPSQLDSDTVVDISHEALIRCWTAVGAPRDGWLHREFSDGLVWRSLLVQAGGYQRNRSSVLSGAATEEWEPWFAARTARWAERYGGRYDDVKILLQASRKAIEQKQLQERARRISRLAFDQRVVEVSEAVVRPVRAEILRSGPPYNQLLSPLTSYLAIAGDAGFGVVSIPYDHAHFERRLKELRYETGDPVDRQAMLHAMGNDMGNLLASIPGLAGVLSVDSAQLGLLIHLRLTLSASELASLPFELAKSAVSHTAADETWMCIQTRPPVCVTRSVRTVSPEGLIWPDRPRIVFISTDPEQVPFEGHYHTLLQAIAPFRRPVVDDPIRTEDGSRQQFGDLLTVLVNPSLVDVLRECRDSRYTHVHILAQADVDIGSASKYGLALRASDGSTDVVSAERLASALISLDEGRLHRPTVVTIAASDSGNVGSVVAGASFAHALHQAGIPLVVASQFPLSKEGSISLAGTLYEGLLWGKHPLVLLQQVRGELHARYSGTWHDWASLVVYESLPQDLTEQLAALRYAQSRRALNGVLEQIDIAVRAVEARPRPDSLRDLERAVEMAVERLPMTGRFAAESIGLRASAWKRLAEASFVLVDSVPPDSVRLGKGSYELLDEAIRDYELAARGLLVPPPGPMQRIATLYWVLGQIESLSLALGRELSESRWHAAKLSADLYCDHVLPEERAWAHASRAELWLLRLGSADLSESERGQCAAMAVEEIEELKRLLPWGDEFPVRSTRRQLQRYVEWWGTDRFEHELADRGLHRRVSWRGTSGLVETAHRLIARLDGPGTERHRTPSSIPPAPRATALPVGVGDAAPSRPVSPARSTLTGANALVFDVTLLPAGSGDALWIEYGHAQEIHRVLVDCGTPATATVLLRRIDALSQRDRRLELLVLSHLDSDHIGGALPFFKTVRHGLTIGDVWFNGWRHVSNALTAREGEMISTALQDLDLPWNAWREGAAIVVDDDPPVCVLPGGMTLTLLSPTPAQLRKLAPVWTRELKRYGLVPGSRVDYSRFLKGTPSTSTDIDVLADTPFGGDSGAPNGSSIALLAEFGGAAILLAADAHAPVLCASIRQLLAVRGTSRLKLDAFKVSHHGSRGNVSSDLIKLLDCRHYLISTNGDHFNHPDREAIARIIKYGGTKPVLQFNYRSPLTAVWERPDLQGRYGHTTVYPDYGDTGAAVSLLEKDVTRFR